MSINWHIYRLDQVGRGDDAIPVLSKFIEIREGQSANELANRAREYANEKQYDKEFIYLYRLASVLAEHLDDPLLKIFKANIE